MSTDLIQIASWIKKEAALCQYTLSKQTGKGKWPKIHCYGESMFSQMSTISIEHAETKTPETAPQCTQQCS